MAPDVEAAFTGWASYMVDHPVPLNRAKGNLAFSAKVEGGLYWGTIFAYNQKDPWQDVYAFGGNGDGTLFYPGLPDKIGGTKQIPIESLRLKAIRDGLEDYEFLRLLSRQGPSSAAFAEEASRRLAHSGYEITLDPTVWEQTRREIVEKLEPAIAEKASVR